MATSRVTEISLLKSLQFLTSSGVALHEAMAEFASKIKDQKMAEKLSVASDLMKNGKSFPDAVEQVDLFTAFLGILRLGEKTGTLPTTMREVALAQEKIEKVVGHIRASLYYPIILLFVAIAVGFGITFSIENLANAFNTPAMRSTFALKAALFVAKYRVYIFASYTFLLISCLYWSAKHVDKLPVIKSLYNGFMIGRSFKLCSLGLSSGLTLQDSLYFAAQASTGKWSDLLITIAEEASDRSADSIVDEFDDYMDTDSFLVLRTTVRAGKIQEGFAMIGDREIDKAFEMVTAFSPLLNAFAMIIIALQLIAVMSPIYMLMFAFMDRVGGKGGF